MDTISRRYLSLRAPTVGALEQTCRLNIAGGDALAVVLDGRLTVLTYHVTADGQTAKPVLLTEDHFHSTIIDMVLSIHYAL